MKARKKQGSPSPRKQKLKITQKKNIHRRSKSDNKKHPTWSNQTTNIQFDKTNIAKNHDLVI